MTSTEAIARGAVEGFLKGTFRGVGELISKRRRRSIVFRITELVAEAEFSQQRNDVRLVWVFYELLNEARVGQAVKKLMHDPEIVPDLIKEQVQALAELKQIGKRLGDLDVRAVIPAA